MFIHIGGDVVVVTIEVVAIIDANHVERSMKKNNYLLNKVEKSHHVVKITSEDIKSIVITTDTIYYSPISSLTLKKRATSLLKKIY